MPIISAIITTFNRADYLKLAIQSVLEQTHDDFELLILDNSSADHTEVVVSSFQDKRIRYIKHPPLNISQTRNLGVKEAKGEYIAFLDDDDEWLPTKLEKELGLFLTSHEEVALIYGGFVRMDAAGNALYEHQPILKGKILKELLALTDEYTGSASNPMIRKKYIESLGYFDETVRTGEDWELYLRLSEKYLVDYVDEPVVKVRHHFGVRLGDRLYDYIMLETQVLERFKIVFDQDNGLKSFYFQRIGGKYIRLGELKNGRQYLYQSLKLNPYNFRAYSQLLISFLGKNAYHYFHKLYLNIKRPFKV